MRVITIIAVAVLATGCVTVTRKGSRFGVGPGLAMRPMVDRQGWVDPTAHLMPATDNPLEPEATPGAPRHGDAQLDATERAVAAIVASVLTGQLPLLEIFAVW